MENNDTINKMLNMKIDRVANVHNKFALSFDNTAIFNSNRHFIEAAVFSIPKGISRICIDINITERVIKCGLVVFSVVFVSRIVITNSKAIIGIERGSPM